MNLTKLSIIGIICLTLGANALAQTSNFKYKHKINGLVLGSNQSSNTPQGSSQIGQPFSLSTDTLDFGKISSQNIVSKTIAITNSSSGSISPTILANSFVSITNNCGPSLASGQSCSVLATPVFSMGLKSGNITLSASGVSRTVAFSFEGVLEDKIQPNLDTLDFGNLQEDQSSSKNLLIMNTGESVYTPELTASAGFSISSSCYTLYPQSSCWVTVTALGSPANFNGTLTVKGGSSVKAVSLVSSVTPNVAAVDASVSALDFGSLLQGQTNDKSFMVMNVGNTVYTPELSVTQGYKVVSGCYRLYPQTPCWVTVTALGDVANPNGIFTVKGGPAVKTVPLTSSVSALVDNVDASVNSIDFGSLIEGQTVQGRSVMVLNTGNTIYTPQITVTPGFTVSSACYNTYPQNGCWITVFSDASAANPTGTVTIKGGSATKTVSLTSVVSPVRDGIDATVSSIDFGALTEGQNVQGRYFTVLNTGNTIFTPQFTVSPGFTVVSGCYSTYPQNGCWAMVSSNASAANQTGTLTIKGGTATKTITLTSVVQ